MSISAWPVHYRIFKDSPWRTGIGIGKGEGDLEVIVDAQSTKVVQALYDFRVVHNPPITVE